MQRDEARRIITAQFYQSLAEGKTEIDAIPQNQLQTIVDAIADCLFAFVEAIEAEDSALGQPALPDPDKQNPLPEKAETRGAVEAATKHEEKILWQGRPFLTLGLRYELTNERLRIIRGILSKNIEEIELIRMIDSEVNQNVGERVLNLGDITIYSNDPSASNFQLSNITDPIAVRELLRDAMMNEKERRGMSFQEEVQSNDG